MATVLQDFLSSWKPNNEAAKVHIRLAISNYSKLDTYKFHKQLDVTTKNLHLVGFNKYYAIQLVSECLEEAGLDKTEWYGSRMIDEIVPTKEEN